MLEIWAMTSRRHNINDLLQLVHSNLLRTISKLKILLLLEIEGFEMRCLHLINGSEVLKEEILWNEGRSELENSKRLIQTRLKTLKPHLTRNLLWSRHSLGWTRTILNSLLPQLFNELRYTCSQRVGRRILIWWWMKMSMKTSMNQKLKHYLRLAQKSFKERFKRSH